MAEEAAAVWAGLVRTCGDPRDLELAARRVLQEHAQPPSLAKRPRTSCQQAT